MTAMPRPALSLHRRVAALTIAAVVGVATDGALQQARAVIIDLIVAGRVETLPSRSLVLLYLTIGSFVAVPLCLLVGLPIWYRLERSGRRGRRDAIRAGLIAGSIIGVIMGAIDIAYGLSIWLDDTSSYSSAIWGVWIVVDGMPTAAGWLFEVLDLGGYMIAGIGAVLIARQAAISGRPKRPA